MAKFRLTLKAVSDLSEIWNYTLEKWSENQADSYYQEIIDSFYKIAKKPEGGKSYTSIIPGLLGFKVNKHLVFYRHINSDYVEIIRILHERMDLKSKFMT